MTRFTGCIDLHAGKVKQIVGGTLADTDDSNPTVNFVSSHSPSYYARLYAESGVSGSHVIKLGPKNDEAALEALKTAIGFLQVGGGINIDNCQYWLQYASKVIVTSWLFDKVGSFQIDRLKAISERCGKDRLVVDLSCRRVASATEVPKWVIAMNKWQTMTKLELNQATLELLANYTDEFLVHAADVEGLCGGIDEELVEHLGKWAGSLKHNVTIVYAGGAKSIKDLEQVEKLSNGKVDLTYGSSLDIFGGKLVRFIDCCRWNQEHHH
ncbi:HDL085Cp [Eremothecium sinecaudum]|uniref:1-(5-phosphoribosyl)-5-[(5-phosphoribosylamino)methylideneamino] imidazole-4-carboxamide isomerase n=1 Tax=Eremothecium sinecaudum TaxID=45286 RepID=A0A0X8HSJ3_9SACH|nr:HDL085Cp [Eremothecium sinecaudum]AMD20659.1 HDL085Cp [Eremothecium sinecaudum]